MAEITKQALTVQNNTEFPNNNNGAIAPSNLRSFNVNMIDSLVDEISYNVDSGSWNNSISRLNTFTSSQQPSFTALNAFTASQLTINSGVNTFTQSATGRLNNLEAYTASYIPTIGIYDEGNFVNNAFAIDFNGNGITASYVSSKASVTVDFTQLNASTASQQISINNLNTNSASVNTSITNLNASSASQQVSINALNVYTASQSTASIVSSISQLNASSASQQVSIDALNVFTASATGLTTGSLLITASFNNGTRNLTFTKGDASTFAVNIPDVSGSTINTGSFVTTSSFNAYTASNDQRVSSLQSTTASLLIETQNLELFSASALVSISNLNASSASQQISINALNTNSASVNTSITNVNSATASLFTSVNNLNTTTASLLVETQNLETFSASALISISNINSATSSLFTSASLALVTASVSGTTMTFTKGNGTTFNVTLPTGSGGGTIATGSFATTGSNSFNGNQTIAGGLLVSGSNPIGFSGSAFRVDTTGGMIFKPGTDITFQGNTVFTNPIRTSLINVDNLAGGGYYGFNAEVDGRIYQDFSGSVNSRINSIVAGTGFATTGSNTFRGNQILQSGFIQLPNGFTIQGNSGDITNLSAGNTIQFITEPPAGPGGTNDIKFINRVSGSSIIFENTQGGVGNRIDLTGGEIRLFATAASGSNGEITIGANTVRINASSTPIVTAAVTASALLVNGNQRIVGIQSITGSIEVSGSGIGIVNQSANNAQYLSTGFGGAIGTYKQSDFTEIGLATDGNAFTTNWANGPIIYVNNTAGDTYEGVFGFQDKTNYTDGRITALKPLVVSGSLSVSGSSTIRGNQTITGSLTISGSSEFDLTIQGRGLISGPTTGQTPQLLISGSDFNNRVGRRSMSILQSGRTFGTGMDVGRIDASVGLAGPAILNLAVFDEPDYVTDIELLVQVATGSGIQFQDIRNDTYDYVTWLKIAPNGGSNPPLEFKRGMQVTGSVSIAPTHQVRFATGSNQQAGTAVLDGGNPGTVTVSNSLVTANSIIMVSKQTLAHPNGYVAVSSKGAGTFTITSNHNGDTDTVGWFIINNS